MIEPLLINLQTQSPHTLSDEILSGMSGTLLKIFMRQIVIIKAHSIPKKL